MTAWEQEYVWVWDDPDAGTGFYGALLSESDGQVRVRVVTRGTRAEHVIGSIASVPAEHVVHYSGAGP